MFTSIANGKVKNLFLADFNISGGTNIGAIANVMNGTASGGMGCIYNCGVLSGSISGSGNVGSLVGNLGRTGSNSNCYARGLVGYNCYASVSSNIRSMVMNCMFYGNIIGGTNVSPIYGGNTIRSNRTAYNNTGINNYNYYRFASTIAGRNVVYNCALAAEDRFLSRFEFYRYLLNSNRELAAWYATGSTANARTVMAKWVLETADRDIDSPKPFPVLKR